ncbi:conserved protein of unknown function (plasmid) [Enterobacter cancerogenus]|uniref:hypothetical protein n=1 Tax=Enterobacter cancerogenus TaxID=69218 RepID=UPI001925EAB8|nr:hypothetical protein [Enterobacter cancerogenus]CAD5360638.1 conserved protein of unknown function [Enterobacter cancerogenus]
MIFKINTNTSAYKGNNVPYFQDVSIISSCLYISQGLIHFCQDVKCVARSDLIDHFSAYYLSKNSHILTSKMCFTPYHHYVIYLSTSVDTMLADLMTLIVITNNLSLTSTITVLSEWPPDFIYHTLRLNLRKRVALAKCRWISAKSSPSVIGTTIPYPSSHSTAIMLERGVENAVTYSCYIGLTYFEIKMLALFFRHPHPDRRNAEMRSKKFHYHKLSGLRKLAQLPGKEGQTLADVIHSKKKLPGPL